MKEGSLSKNAVYYSNIKSIPAKVWDSLDCSSNLYFHPDYLNALEKNNGHLQFFYVVLKDSQNKSIAFASVQLIDFHIDSLTNSERNILTTIAHYGRKLKILPKEKPLKILNCGNNFVSGEHGIYIKEGVNKKRVLRQLIKAIAKYTQEFPKHFPIDIFIVKDFVTESLTISNELISLGYYAFNVEPNMKLIIDSSWLSFDDYLKALKTKFRVKAKRAFELSKKLEVKNIDAKNIDSQLPEMIKLYQKVTDKADFNLGNFNLNTYKMLKEKLPEQYFLQSYWLNNKMVGFLSGIINQQSMDAHFVGIDYELNKAYAIYQRMLYDYINIAIKSKVEVINFGRTASEIKSSVGATPEHLTVYIRHKKSITNRFLRLFLLKIQPTEFNQKLPFKTPKRNQ